MKKIFSFLLIIVSLTAIICCSGGCFLHVHSWIPATCDSPMICRTCGQIEGKALGHSWLDATCLSPKKCSRCGIEEGRSLGHDWSEATCLSAKTCQRCGSTDGKALGHDVPGLSCTQGATCKRCGQDVNALGHNWIDATCLEPKRCDRCGIIEGKALGHSLAQPVKENEVSATCTDKGHWDEVIYCLNCKEELSRTSKTAEALGHTTNNGVCERCGYEIYKTVSGKGDDVLTNITVGDGLYRVRFKNSGKSNFVVWVHDVYGDKDLAVNEIGNFDGYYLLLGTAPYMFEIESSGKWSYTIEKLVKTSETSFKGKGCFVTNIIEVSSGSWTITHNGKSNFIVWAITTSGRDLIVNEIGVYNGKKYISIPKGSNVVFAIEADGNWSITPA